MIGDTEDGGEQPEAELKVLVTREQDAAGRQPALHSTTARQQTIW